MERKTFKERWNEVNEVCPACGNVTKEKRGLTKQNLKKLFRKPTAQDWMLFIIIALALMGTYAYYSEVKQYREIIENPEELCLWHSQRIISGDFGEINTSDIKIIKENEAS